MGQYGGLPPDAAFGSLHDDLLNDVHAAVSCGRAVEDGAHVEKYTGIVMRTRLSSYHLCLVCALKHARQPRHRKALFSGSGDLRVLADCSAFFAGSG